MDRNYIIRNMSLNEVKDIAIKWAAEEGWNPGLYDHEAFYQADPKGFYVGLLDNKPIASISIVNYGNNFTFLGLYIVKSDYRGQGYGLTLWQSALEHYQNYNIGLDGVVDQQANYRKSNFKFAYNNIRFEGKSKLYPEVNANVEEFNESMLNELMLYDHKYFPVQRKQFLNYWLNSANSITLVSKNNKTINGYITIRKCLKGYKIGPLFAENFEIANALFKSINNKISPDKYIYLDIPEPNKYANELVNTYQMNKVFETARMYNQTLPDINLENIFGVTTFELG
ncbi:GNAT family N-acetyltransferase [Francisellaceae bacterium]|nr:GNAT family N-acetyltransferase [Francisellaceae bacterium]